MADDTQLNVGTGGDLIATDELTTLNGGAVSLIKAQRVKVGWGIDGTFNDTNAANPLPVSFSFTGLTNAELRAVAVPVSGTVTANAGTGTMAVSLATAPSTPVTALVGDPAFVRLSNGTSAISTLPVSLAALPALSAGAAAIGSINNTTFAATQATAANLQMTASIAAAQTLATVTTVGTVNSVAAMTPATPTAFLLNSAATTNAVVVKGSAGTLHQITLSNNGAAQAFVKLYNLAVAPTVGTSVPAIVIPVGAAASVTVNFAPMGQRFTTGIGLAITNLIADTDATAVVAGQVKVAASFI